MTTTTFRHFNFILLSLLALLLVGCFDSEPKERKAYNEFLTVHAIPAKGAFVVYPNQKDIEAMGRYAASYKVVTDYTDKLEQKTNELQDTMQQLRALQSLAELQKNWQNIDGITQSMVDLAAAQKVIYNEAIAAKDAVKHPEDTQKLFDQLFDKKVAATSGFIDQLVPPMSEAMVTYKKIGQFLDENQDKIELKGSMAVMEDQKLLDQFNAMINEMNEKQTTLLNATNNALKAAKGQ